MSTQANPVVANHTKANGGVDPEKAALLARIAELEKAAAVRSTHTLTVKVMDIKSDGTPGNGGIAVFGLQRFPVVLYAEQWERLLTEPVIKAILAECKSPKASRKPAKA